jgi:VWFA-related protein
LLLSIPLFGAFALLSQQQTPEMPVLRVGTRVVEVNVIARAKDAPVRDLTAADFALYDNGKPRKIDFFTAVSGRETRKSADPLPANVATNRAERHGGAPASATVVLIDRLNTDAVDQLYAREQVIRFLRQLRPEDRVAIYCLTGGLRILQDFTGDSAQLVRTLGGVSATSNALLEASNPAPVDIPDDGTGLVQWLDAVNQEIRMELLAQRARITANALETIAYHLRDLPGRKSLVWVSAGFPLSTELLVPAGIREGGAHGSSFDQDIHRAARALNDANVAIYAVDARGLLATPGRVGAAAQGTMNRSIAMRPGAELSAFRLSDSWGTMDAVSSETGGRMFYGVNDIEGSLRRVLDDSEWTYTLAFSPADSELDSRAHNLKVEVKRKGVELRYRRSYLASPDSAADVRTAPARVRDALDSPLDEPGVSITARWGQADSSQVRRLTIMIDPADVTLEQKGGRWQGSLQLDVSRRAADGRELSSQSQTMRLDLDQALYDRLRRQGFIVVREIAPAPNLASVRIVALDKTAGRLGALTAPLPKGK